MEIYTTPTHEEFLEYAYQHGWNDWAEDLWNELERTNWLKNDGTQPKNWHAIVNARNGTIMHKLGVSLKREKESSKYSRNGKEKEKIVINEIEKEFSKSEIHYVCYTDGFCDYHSNRIGSASYIVIKGGNIIKEQGHAQFTTSHQRMELLAIISAVNSCPEGAFVDIYTDSTYCILVLSKSYGPEKNSDLYDLYRKCSDKLAAVRFHWIESSNENKYNKRVHQLAYNAYSEFCDKNNIGKAKIEQ